MKKVILIVAICISLFAETKGNLTASQVLTAQKLIKAYGYKCDMGFIRNQVEKSGCRITDFKI